MQIFVKMDGGKTSAMEMEMNDKVDDILKKIPISDQDVYVTSVGRILRRSDKLKSCEVRDGSTVEVTSRMRGGGRHKDKKSKSEKRQTTNPEKPEQKRDGESRSDEGPEMITLEEAQRISEEDEGYQKNIERASEGSEGEVQQNVQNYLAHLQKVSWMNKEQLEHLESGVWRAVEARRKGRDEDQEQRRQAEQGQEQSKQGEPEMMGRTTEVRTGRGHADLVPGGDESRGLDKTIWKGKGKGNGGKGEHEGTGGFGRKGFQQSVREEKEERVPMAPNMGQVAHTPRPRWIWEREIEEKRETRGMRWADCEDDEGKEKEDQEKEKETRQETKEAEGKKEQEAERKQEQEQEGPPGRGGKRAQDARRRTEPGGGERAGGARRRRKWKSAGGARGGEESAGGARGGEESAGGATGGEESAGGAREGEESAGGARGRKESAGGA